MVDALPSKMVTSIEQPSRLSILMITQALIRNTSLVTNHLPTVQVRTLRIDHTYH